MITAEAAADLTAGLALLLAGGVSWIGARQSRTGPLLFLAGATWLAGDVTGVLVYAHRGPLIHALLTFPTGRTRSKPIIVIIVLAYMDSLVPVVAREPWTTIALMMVVASAATWRWAAQPFERRAHAVAAMCTAAFTPPLVAAAVARLTARDVDVVAAAIFEAAILFTAVALPVDLLVNSSVRSATTGLVVRLGGRQEPRALRDALAEAVEDATLQIAYRVEETWVDEKGQPVQLPTPDGLGRRVVTLVEDNDTPVAALIHDPAALRDARMAQSASAAVRLVLANVRLSAEDASRMRDVSASRRRLVEAGDAERRRLREQLLHGAERQLADVSADLIACMSHHDGKIAATLLHLVQELEGASEDLARFAQGVHPRALTERGLADALRELAAHAAVPVILEVPAGRFPAAQEAAVYFVCSEALTNVAKYAEATGASISVSAVGSRLSVRIQDDGQGGAEPDRGSGLRGLADRVEALGGRLSISSRAGAGTRIEADLPCGEYAA